MISETNPHLDPTLSVLYIKLRIWINVRTWIIISPVVANMKEAGTKAFSKLLFIAINDQWTNFSNNPRRCLVFKVLDIRLLNY